MNLRRENHGLIDAKSQVAIGYGIASMAAYTSGVRLEEHMNNVILRKATILDNQSHYNVNKEKNLTI